MKMLTKALVGTLILSMSVLRIDFAIAQTGAPTTAQGSLSPSQGEHLLGPVDGALARPALDTGAAVANPASPGGSQPAQGSPPAQSASSPNTNGTTLAAIV